MSRHLASFPMASSTSAKKANPQQNQQKAMSDPTATARRSVTDRKNSSRLKPNGQPRRSVADRKPKTSLFGTDSLPPGLLYLSLIAFTDGLIGVPFTALMPPDATYDFPLIVR